MWDADSGFNWDGGDDSNVVALDPFVVTAEPLEPGDEGYIDPYEFDEDFSNFLFGDGSDFLLDLQDYGFSYDPSGIQLPGQLTPKQSSMLENALKKATDAFKAKATGGTSGGGGSSGGSSSTSQPKPTNTTTSATYYTGLQTKDVLMLGGLAVALVFAVKFSK